MHYRSGKAAQINDLIVMRQEHGNVGSECAGILTSAQASSTSCNGNMHVLARRTKSDLGWGPWLPAQYTYDTTVTLSECDKVESFEGAPPPVGGGPGDPKK